MPRLRCSGEDGSLEVQFCLPDLHTLLWSMELKIFVEDLYESYCN
jgi:hypothetical protein